jgi:pimeloyl-ACP methyl ester carboxylesterase
VSESVASGVGGTTSGLAARQADLVAALVADGPVPTGFDPARLDATRRALLRKRASEAAKVWPLLAASLGAEWPRAFAPRRAGHEPVGPLRDGWDIARALQRCGELSTGAAGELAEREAAFRYDGHSDPRPRSRSRVRRMIAILAGRH